MTCDRAIRLVEKLADGEARPSERSEAESHLESCEECRSHYEFVRALVSASENIDWPKPPEAYWRHLPSKVLRRLEREVPVERRSFWPKLLTPPVLRFGAVAATLSVVVAIGYSVVRNDQLRPEAETAPTQPSAGKRRVDEKAAGVSGESALEPAPRSVDRASMAPEESGRVESARRTTRTHAESLESAPASLQTLPEKEGELAGLDSPADGANPAGGVAGQSFEDEPAAVPSSGDRENRMLQSFAESPGEPLERTAATEETTSSESAPPELARKQVPLRASSSVVTSRCSVWRDYLARNGDDGSDSLEALYQVALCSLERYVSEPSDEARAEAVQDVEAFLAMESDSDRADEVRVRVERLRR